MVFGTLIVGGLGYAFSRAVGGGTQINTLVINATTDPEIGVITVCQGVFDIQNFYIKLDRMGEGTYGTTQPLYHSLEATRSPSFEADFVIKLYKPLSNVSDADLKREILIQFESSRKSRLVTKILPVLIKKGNESGCIMQANEGFLSDYLIGTISDPVELVEAFKKHIGMIRDALRDANVIHFDLKYDNVMYHAAGWNEVEPKIIDFGFARQGSSDDGDLVFYILSVISKYRKRVSTEATKKELVLSDEAARGLARHALAILLKDRAPSDGEVDAILRCSYSRTWRIWHNFSFARTGYYRHGTKNILGEPIPQEYLTPLSESHSSSGSSGSFSDSALNDFTPEKTAERQEKSNSHRSSEELPMPPSPPTREVDVSNRPSLPDREF